LLNGRYAEAIDAYGQAIALDPANGDVNVTLYTNRATAKSKSGDMTGAIGDCNQALRINPRHIKALLRRAAAQLEGEDYTAAIADLEEAQGYTFTARTL
jgi:DnaJ family protein C protein 7